MADNWYVEAEYEFVGIKNASSVYWFSTYQDALDYALDSVGERVRVGYLVRESMYGYPITYIENGTISNTAHYQHFVETDNE